MKHQQPNLLFLGATGTKNGPRYLAAAGQAPGRPETVGDEGPR